VRYGNAVEVSNAGDDNIYRDADQDRPGNDGKDLAVRGKTLESRLLRQARLKSQIKKREGPAALTT